MIWQATMALRLREHEHWPDDETRELYFVLEQMWVSSHGDTEWREVSVVDEGGLRPRDSVMLRGRSR